MKKKKITIYLHIGAGKTGTSSIQNFLKGNMDILFQLCSCIYPKPNKGVNHNKLFKNPDKKAVLAIIEREIAFCKKNKKEKIVFSSETLFESQFGPEIAKKISEIPQVDLKIIVYIRRQDLWLESAWKQWGYKMEIYKDLSNYIKRRDCNWYKKIKLWEEAIGKERIIVRCYEKEQLPHGLIPDFITAIGIDYDSYTWVNREDRFKGFNRDVMEILFLNKNFCENSSDNRLQSFFERNLDKSYQKEFFKSYSLLSPLDRISILEKYDTSNQLIAREYLKRSDGRLFYEPWPSMDDEWEPYRGLTIESIVPIFTQILYNLEQKHKAVNKQNNRRSIKSIVRFIATKIGQLQFIDKKNNRII